MQWSPSAGSTSPRVPIPSRMASYMCRLPPWAGILPSQHTQPAPSAACWPAALANGNPAFCLDPTVSGLNAGVYAIDYWLDDPNDFLVKCCYYLYGGPGYGSVKNTAVVTLIHAMEDRDAQKKG